MLNQALEVFKNQYGERIDNIILANYIPADGSYVVVKPTEGSFEVDEIVNIKLNNKTKELMGQTHRLFPFICMADYNSKLVSMDKPIDSKKKIHSNNYLSFIIKKESLTNGKLTEEVIDNYYKVLENPLLKYSKPKAMERYKSIEKEIGEPDRDRILKIKEWIKANIFTILEDNLGKDYLKVFFKYSDEEFKAEGRRYLIPNIYNKNDFNVKVREKINGLPNDNMGLNDKKPYLINKTRKSNIPYLINEDEVIYQKKFFDYLMNQVAAGYINIYMGEEIEALKNGEVPKKDFRGMYFRLKKGKEVEIHDFEVIPRYSPKLKKVFEYRNVLNGDNKFLKQDYHDYETKKEMQKIIHEGLFSKMLIGNYFTEANDISIKDNCLKSNLLVSRTALFNWIYKDNENNVGHLLDKISLSLIKGAIRDGYRTRAIRQFNLRACLNKYFQDGGEDMADIILDMKESLKDKVLSNKYKPIESDEEYFFAVGQLVSLFLAMSKGSKKPLSLVNPFINAKKDRIIKETLKRLFKKYNYTLDEKNSKRIKALYSMIVSYEVEGEVNDDMIIAGYLHSNVIYEKSNKESRDNNGEGEN